MTPEARGSSGMRGAKAEDSRVRALKRELECFGLHQKNRRHCLLCCGNQNRQKKTRFSHDVETKREDNSGGRLHFKRPLTPTTFPESAFFKSIIGKDFRKSRGKLFGSVRRGGDGGCEGFPLRISGSGGGRAANIQDFKARQTLAFLKIDIHIPTRRLSLP